MAKAKAKTINFIKTVLDTLPIPEGDRVYYRDKAVKGLVLGVMPTGTKTFFLYKRIGLRPVRYKIGRYEAVGPDQARKEAIKLLGRIELGDDPQEEKRWRRRESANAKSLQQVWERYRDNHLAKNCSPKAARNSGYLFTPIPFKTKKLGEIRIEDARQLHENLKDRPIMANAVLTFLRTLYNYAAAEMDYTGPNPIKIIQKRRGDRRRTTGIVLNPKKSRDRFLQPDELPKFFKALKSEPDEDFRDLVLLLLFTGARRGNVQEMRWSEISLARALWKIPKTKNGDAVTVALSPWALEVLQQRAGKCGQSGPSEFVFPSARAKSGHIEEPKKQWWDLLERAKLTDLHMHDLRRTLATYQRSTGATLEVIGAALGHRSRQATEIYARIDIEPVRKAINAATQKIADDGELDLNNLLPSSSSGLTASNSASAPEAGNGKTETKRRSQSNGA